MKYSLGFLQILVFTFCLIGCSKEKEQSDYIIFGKFYGMCGGDCFEVYKLKEGKLYEDTLVNYYMESFQFKSSQKRSIIEYQIAFDNLMEIPDELLQANSQDFGCPDCYDQGGYYLSFRKQGNTLNFIIDPANTEDQSPEIIMYKEKMGVVLDAIQ